MGNSQEAPSPVAWMHDGFVSTNFERVKHDESRNRASGFKAKPIIPLYTHPPQQLKPLTRSMQAEIECGCLVAWNASTYGHSKQDTVHPMFLSAFILGYWAAERAHGITGEQE